jgi:hypothetical protein
MARPLEFKPYRLADGKWQVNVPDWLSRAGKRQRLTFDSRQAALAQIEELNARRDNLAAAVKRPLSTAELLDAAAALDLLAERPSGSLLDAARLYIEVAKTQRASITLAELFSLFEEAKKHRSKAYRRDISWARKRIAPFAEKLV